MKTITTVWADHLGTETRHTRRVESHVTLCGLGTNLTRNFSKHPREDHRCQRCQAEVEHINAVEATRRRAEAAWQWPEHAGAGPRIDSLNFPSALERES